MNAEMFAEIMKELPALITENDLHISQVGQPGYGGMCMDGVVIGSMLLF